MIFKMDVKAEMEKLIGRRCQLIKRHPCAGEKGKASRVEFTDGKHVLYVQLDNGYECLVPHPQQIIFEKV